MWYDPINLLIYSLVITFTLSSSLLSYILILKFHFLPKSTDILYIFYKVYKSQVKMALDSMIEIIQIYYTKRITFKSTLFHI